MEFLLLAGLIAAGFVVARGEGSQAVPPSGAPSATGTGGPASAFSPEAAAGQIFEQIGEVLEERAARIQAARDTWNEWAIIANDAVDALPDEVFARMEASAIFDEVHKIVPAPWRQSPKQPVPFTSAQLWAWSFKDTFLGRRVKRVRIRINENTDSAKSESPHLFVKAPTLPDLGEAFEPGGFQLP